MLTPREKDAQLEEALAKMEAGSEQQEKDVVELAAQKLSEDTPENAPEGAAPAMDMEDPAIYTNRPDVAEETPNIHPQPRLPQLEQDLAWKQQQEALATQIRMRDEQLAEFKRAKNASSSDVWSAAFTTENSLISWAVQEPLPNIEPVEGYSPFDIAEDGSSDIDGYEQFADIFMESRSPEETAILKQRIQRENKHRTILSESPIEGFVASLAAGVTDPINLATMVIPIAGQANLAKQMGFAAMGAMASEVGLHATQETRTVEESVVNSVGSALLTGVLGNATRYLTKAQENAIIEEVTKPLQQRSAGAMQVSETGAKIVLNGPLSRLAATMTKITPLGRALQSEVARVRSTMQKLADSRIELEGNYTPTSTESLVKTDHARFDVAMMEVRRIQSEYKKKNGGSSLDFSRELVHAMRRGDVHTDPLIEKAAKRLRKEMDGLWSKAYDQKLSGTYKMVVDESGDTVRVPVETSTAKSYMTRRYDMNVVRANPEAFKRAWMKGIADQRQRNGEDVLPENELYEVANDVYERISNMKDGDVHFEVGPSGASMLKERVDIKDEFVEDFLVKDWEQLMVGYVRSLSPRVRLTEMFGNKDGDFSLKSEIDSIRDEYTMQINRIDKGISKAEGSEKRKLQRKKNKLLKQMQSDVRDIEIVRDRLLNIDQNPSWMNPENRGMLSALRTMRSWNILASLSNIVVSSIPDMARVITYHGGGKFAKAFARSAFSREIARSNIPKNELAKMASAMERASVYRLSHLTEVDDGVVFTRADKFMHAAADAVLTASGSKHWNSMTKTIVGHLFSDKLGLAIKGNDVSAMKRLGFTDEMIEEAAKEFKAHGSLDDGLWNLNVDRWANRELVENIEAAAIKEADSIVITPGAGDKPILMTTEMGRTIFQFMSFMVSATNKMTLPLVQEKGLRPWMEISTQIGLGATVYALKQKIADKEIDTSPEIILQEAVANTGLMGYGSQLYSAATSAMGINPLSDEGVYYQHHGLSRILGPSAGLVENLLRIPNAETSAEQRSKSIRRLMPMQNHFILRNGYDEVEKQMTEMFGGGTETPQF